jgi:hypothetical protein
VQNKLLLAQHRLLLNKSVQVKPKQLQTKHLRAQYKMLFNRHTDTFKGSTGCFTIKQTRPEATQADVDKTHSGTAQAVKDETHVHIGIGCCRTDVSRGSSGFSTSCCRTDTSRDRTGFCRTDSSRDKLII